MVSGTGFPRCSSWRPKRNRSQRTRRLAAGHRRGTEPRWRETRSLTASRQHSAHGAGRNLNLTSNRTHLMTHSRCRGLDPLHDLRIQRRSAEPRSAAAGSLNPSDGPPAPFGVSHVGNDGFLAAHSSFRGSRRVLTELAHRRGDGGEKFGYGSESIPRRQCRQFLAQAGRDGFGRVGDFGTWFLQLLVSRDDGHQRQGAADRFAIKAAFSS